MNNSNDIMNSMLTQSNFKFSAVDVGTLTSSEYTLVNISVDLSGSVSNYYSELVEAIKTITEACKKSDRAENLMIRISYFNSYVKEYHGFKTLYSIDQNDYDKIPRPNGITALYDATIESIESIEQYGKTLTDQEFETNGILFVITDGDNNSGNNNINSVVERFNKLKRSEALESLQTFLIGVNTNNNEVKKYLENFNKEVGFDNFLEIENANSNSLAKLAKFVSKSISLQSQALGSGGASQQIASF